MQPTGIGEIDRALVANYGRLSAAQRLTIDALLGDARYGAVVSAPQLAEAAGVSESTVTRAAQALGFAGFPDLQRHLRERFVAPIETRLSDVGERNATARHPAAVSMLDDALRIREMAEDFPVEAFDRVVSQIVAAKRVLVFGERGSHGLALMLSLGLRLLLDDVRLLTQAAGDVPDQLLGLGSGDLVVAISFRRVDRVTVDVLKRARQQGAATVALADHRSSAAARAADTSLIVRTGTLRVMPSFAAGASVVNALLEDVASRRHDQVTDRLQEAEELWTQFRSYAEE
ncbi:MAG: MurR/RpiR family transcriptional regulator [Thermomicrobiales bacterium]